MVLTHRPMYQNDGAGGSSSAPAVETPPAGGVTEGTNTGGEGATGAEGREATWLPKDQREAAKKAGISTPGQLWSEFEKLKQTAQTPKGVVIPGPNASPEEIAAYHKAVGVPDSPENYTLEKPKLPEGLPYDEGLEKAFRAKAHELKLPAKAAADLFGWWNKAVVDGHETRRKSVESSLEQTRATLIKELGQDEFTRRDTHASSLMEWSGLAAVLRVYPGDVNLKKQGWEAAWKLAGLISPATLDKVGGGRAAGAGPDPNLPPIRRLPLNKSVPKKG